MKLFKFTQGWNDIYGAFDSEEEAYERRAEVDHTFHYTDVRITEVKLDGYDIVVYPQAKELPVYGPHPLPVDEIPEAPSLSGKIEEIAERAKRGRPSNAAKKG